MTADVTAPVPGERSAARIAGDASHASSGEAVAPGMSLEVAPLDGIFASDDDQMSMIGKLDRGSFEAMQSWSEPRPAEKRAASLSRRS